MFRFPGRVLLEEWSASRRFNALPAETRSIVFYAEDGDSWSHFEPIVRELTGALGRDVCYLTSSHTDPILDSKNPRIHAFCIGEGVVRTSLFLSMRAGVCVMTMPDLETFHIKRSRREPVHYAYVFHSIVSTHMIYRKAAFDHFDTILCVGPHHVREIRATEQAYGLKPKQLIENGYGRLDTIIENAAARSSSSGRVDQCPHVLIAPSWDPHGLLETRGLELCRVLVNAGFRVTVRPHPMTRRKWPQCVAEIERELAGNPLLSVETGVSSFESLQSADVMISDWSGAALEFAFGFEKPVLFVDVPRKVNNAEYARIACEPLEVGIRERIGRVVTPDQLAHLPQHIHDVIASGESMREQIRQARAEYIYNVGQSGCVAARAIAEIADSVRAETRVDECVTR